MNEDIREKIAFAQSVISLGRDLILILIADFGETNLPLYLYFLHWRGGSSLGLVPICFPAAWAALIPSL